MTERATWNAIEIAPRHEVERLQRDRLREQLAYLRARSELYRDALAATDPDRVEVRDLSGLPFTDKEMLRRSLAERRPLGRHVAAAPASVVQIHTTSGTTGSPAYIGLTPRDRADWLEIFCRGFWANGLRPTDSVLHAFAMSRGYAGALPMVQGILHLGASVIPLGIEAGAERLLDALAQLRPSCLYASPSFTRYLGEAAGIRGIGGASSSVRLVMSGGEPGVAEGDARRELGALWGADVRELMGGSDVCPLLWGECEAQDGMHELAPDLVLTEFIAPENAEVVGRPEAGGVYEIAYTHLRREATPLLRFRQGDLVEVRGTECRCGRTGIRIRGRGRTDDLLIMKGVKLFPSAVADVVAGFRPAVTGELRILRPRRTHMLEGAVHIRVEFAEAGEEPRRVLAAVIEKAIHDRLSVRARVDAVDAGALPPQTGAKRTLLEFVEDA
jgi:phenylacetate-CoA ligase